MERYRLALVGSRLLRARWAGVSWAEPIAPSPPHLHHHPRRVSAAAGSSTAHDADGADDTIARAWHARLSPLAARFATRAAVWCPASEATVPETVGPWRYWSAQAAGEPGPSLFRTPLHAPSAPPALVLDSSAVTARLRSAGGLASIKLSPCGGFVAVVSDADGGPCASVWRVGPDATEVARLPGAVGVEWGEPGSGDLFYTACGSRGDGRPSEVRVAAGLVWGGTSPSPRAGRHHHPLLLAWPDPRSHLALGRTKDGAWLTATAVRRDAAVPHVLRLGGSAPAAHTFAVVGSGGEDVPDPYVETFVEGDGRGGLLLLTNERTAGSEAGGAVSPHEAWLGWAAGPGVPPPGWAPLIPRRSGRVITDLDAFCGHGTAEAVVLYERDTAAHVPGVSLTRLAWGGGGLGAPPTASPPVPVALPPHGAWACIRPGANACPAATTARIVGSSPLDYPRAWDVCLASGAVSAPPVPPPSAAAADAVSAAAAGLRLRRTTIPSTDGYVRIPLTVVEPEMEAAKAALLVLYGAYGTTLEADFDPLWLTLACEGWRVVLAGVRGGGEGGRTWHAAGRGADRPAAAADAEAAAAWASAGGALPVVAAAESAGGLLAGHLLLRGGLAGAILRAPFLDICAHVEAAAGPEADPVQAALAAHEAGEWGPPGDAAALAAVCPATRLAAGPPPPSFPPWRVTAGLTDERVPPADVARFVARWKAVGGGRVGAANPALATFLEGVGHEGPTGEDALECMGLDAAFAVAVAEDAAERDKHKE